MKNSIDEFRQWVGYVANPGVRPGLKQHAKLWASTGASWIPTQLDIQERKSKRLRSCSNSGHDHRRYNF